MGDSASVALCSFALQDRACYSANCRVISSYCLSYAIAHEAVAYFLENDVSELRRAKYILCNESAGIRVVRYNDVKMETIKELRVKLQYKGMPGDPYLERWPSIYVTYLLVQTPITADMVTITMFFSGIAAAIAVVMGYFWLGFILLYVNLLLDMCDGEVARYRNTHTFRGGYLDLVNHILMPPLFFLALAYQMTGLPQHIDMLMLTIGVLGALAFAVRRPNGDLPRVLFVRKCVKHPDLFVEARASATKEQAVRQVSPSFGNKILWMFYESHEMIYFLMIFIISYAIETFVPFFRALGHPILYGLVVYYGVTACLYLAREIYTGFFLVEDRVYSLARKILPDHTM